MDANTLYEGLFTNDGMPLVTLLIGLPILFCFFFPVVCVLIGFAGGLIPFFLSIVLLIIDFVAYVLRSLFVGICNEINPRKQEPVVVADIAAFPAPTKTAKEPQPKKQTHTYTEIETDVAHGLKGLGLTLKDAKTLVKKVTEKNTYSDTVSLMNACLQAINTR